MKIAIIGGKLQGTEAAYLAMKAGFETLIVDKNPGVPARGLCSEFLCCDVHKREKKLIEKLKEADFVLPAMENWELLRAVEAICEEQLIPLAFDMEAYEITASKIRSDQLIQENHIPAPAYYPDCQGSCIAKPSEGSGSEGIQIIRAEDACDFLASKECPEQWIIQEFLQGPSYSIEVIGCADSYQAYEVTKIHMDEVYDCKRVTAPCPITKNQLEGFEQLGIQLAKMVNLYGIMDVEVIDDHGQFKVLEIDARIPSQTPTVVYQTSGINLLEEIADLIVNGKPIKKDTKLKRYCSYEHYLWEDGKLKEVGEHIMASANVLTYRERFMGADEVISDYERGTDRWRGTFINVADTQEELERKRNDMKRKIEDMMA